MKTLFNYWSGHRRMKVIGKNISKVCLQRIMLKVIQNMKAHTQRQGFAYNLHHQKFTATIRQVVFSWKGFVTCLHKYLSKVARSKLESRCYMILLDRFYSWGHKTKKCRILMHVESKIKINKFKRQKFASWKALINHFKVLAIRRNFIIEKETHHAVKKTAICLEHWRD
jgi:hypothetical protein